MIAFKNYSLFTYIFTSLIKTNKLCNKNRSFIIIQSRLGTFSYALKRHLKLIYERYCSHSRFHVLKLCIIQRSFLNASNSIGTVISIESFNESGFPVSLEMVCFFLFHTRELNSVIY
jgi:hypothetical protein